jgi:hypothetical protein
MCSTALGSKTTDGVKGGGVGSSGLSEPVRVASVAEVKALPLETESVFAKDLSDDIAAALARLPRLQRLFQSGSSSITDAGLRSLARISSLEVLDLEWCAQITDDGIAALGGLKSLRWIDLGFCGRVTQCAADRLRSALPGLEIDGFGAAQELGP